MKRGSLASAVGYVNAALSIALLIAAGCGDSGSLGAGDRSSVGDPDAAGASEDAAGDPSQEGVNGAPSPDDPAPSDGPPPHVDPPPESTWRLAVTLTGDAPPGWTVLVDGELTDGEGVVEDDGRYAVGVELRPQALNAVSVRIVSPEGVASAPAQLSIDQHAETVRTKHPLVLHHGYMGFEELVGMPYWWGVLEQFDELGVDARPTQVDPLATIEERSAQLVRTVRRITSGKVNLYGHSMGGLDGRRALALGGLAGQVATLTTVGAPHRGTPVADWVLAGRDQLAAEWLLERLGVPVGGLGDMTVEHMTEVFNKEVLDVEGVRYFSWTSVSDPFGVRTGAPLNPLFGIPYAIIQRAEGDNDGLVSVTSGMWGEHLGSPAADHLDMVGHLLGLTDGFDHLGFWRAEADRLEGLGY